MTTIEFVVKVIDVNNVFTQVWKIRPDKTVYRGYHGDVYIRKSGYYPESRVLLGEIPGILTYAEEREFREVYGND